MSHYLNEIDHPEIVNEDELILCLSPEDGYIGNFKFGWSFIWMLIKAKLKKGKLFVTVFQPGTDPYYDITFYRQIKKK